MIVFEVNLKSGKPQDALASLEDAIAASADSTVYELIQAIAPGDGNQLDIARNSYCESIKSHPPEEFIRRERHEKY